MKFSQFEIHRSTKILHIKKTHLIFRNMYVQCTYRSLDRSCCLCKFFEKQTRTFLFSFNCKLFMPFSQKQKWCSGIYVWYSKALQSFLFAQLHHKKLNNKKNISTRNHHRLQLFRFFFFQKNTLSSSVDVFIGILYSKPATVYYTLTMYTHFSLKIIYIAFVMENNLMPVYCECWKIK